MTPNHLLVNLLDWGGQLFRTRAGREQINREPPLRAELFSADQMERHGAILAASHHLTQTSVHDQLLHRLTDNETVLIASSRILTATVTASRRLTPAGEWLLDNFYLIDEQIRTAKRHLPVGYSRELPRLLNGPSAGLPRVYDLALEAIAHGDGSVGLESLTRFVNAYQGVTPLTLGELWAIPIMLRLALIENLRRIAARIAAGRIDQDVAAAWAQQMIEGNAQDPKSLILLIADMARSNPPMTSSFVAEFTRCLQGQSAALALPLTWIKQLLAESHLSIEQLVQTENQQQAADQVSIGNSINSLRFLGAMDWREFVEAMSVVEQTLREDSSGAYAKMDFATRDRYRHVVEKLARRSPYSEGDIARFAVELTQAGAVSNGANDRQAHVGYYLIDAGLSRLERIAETRRTLPGSLRAGLGRFPLTLFAGSILLLTLLLTGGLLFKAQGDELSGAGLVLLGGLLLLATSHLAVALVNWLATLVTTPQTLPRMDFSTGIPAHARTLVVVPTLLTHPAAIEALLEALEVRFLANQDKHLHFGLLTDFIDAATETTPTDSALLALLQTGITQLNLKYARVEGVPFFLFHRPRRWNAAAQCWMGYERKRGKLADLNALLRGSSGAAFALIIGDITPLQQVKYVITLDTDTQLPRDAARQLIGVMAHPLNQASYDAAKQRVTRGYGILQPRVSVSLSGANLSRYARLHSGEMGIDPYTRAVSDVYQDVFHEGSFVGKGIYDLDAFEQALAERLPDNQILSHDLLEGCYARSGLISDIQLYEEYPQRYRADVSRRQRWIRGDWQLLEWLLPSVPGYTPQRLKNPLSGLSRWKIFDNLRRSLSAAALTTLLLLGWLLPAAGFWTLVVLALLFTPAISTTLFSFARKPVDLGLYQHLIAETKAVGGHVSQATLMLACLPYEAYFSVDALIRTLWRMWVSHQHLLEWNPSSETNTPHADPDSWWAAYRVMWFAPALALLSAGFIALTNLAAGWIAAPVLLLWALSPALMRWLSQPVIRREARLSAKQQGFLHLIARRTWSYFEHLLGDADHWLPPDNYQVYQAVGVAHRTSPTNMGLGLLANLAAYDFGYIPVGVLLERSANSLASMEKLERYQGHFYNWYDTQTLQPLYPLYISSVDSGNLAGHLLTLQPGLLALADQPILNKRWLEGLNDTFAVWLESSHGVTPPQLQPLQTALHAAQTERPTTLSAVKRYLEQLSSLTAALTDNSEWKQAFSQQCQRQYAELQFLVPAELDQEWAGIPTLRELAQHPTTHVHAKQRLATIEQLAQQAAAMAVMQYDFLFDPARRLLAIGYNVSERQRDNSYYDLLASEARLGSFVAIAQEQIPQASWFALGRLLVTTAGEPTLLSWSGSMFEYLMPLLVMPTYANTLIDQTYHAVVQRQINYGKQCSVPWGISESGYNTVDVHLNYQYRAFGVPGLGLKRGLAEDLVIAPYASVLALMVAPEAACLNLQRLAAEGMMGEFGLYEAVDYTPSRQRRGEQRTVIQSFMAHHQGMSLLALAYALLDRPMQQRFVANPLLQSTLLLLQERIPKASAYYTQASGVADILLTASEPQIPVRVLNNPNTPVPEVQLLSNGRYHVMLTNAGGGYSRHKDLAVTRWREDSTCDPWGTFCYIREVASGQFWSTAHQPTLVEADHYEAIFSEGRAEFRRLDHEFETYIDIVVSPEDDIELRRIRITNQASTRRTLDVTSYAEVVLAPAAADALHPAFSNLFVQTEMVESLQALLCTRRPRSTQDASPWLFHLLAVHEGESDGISYETDRAQFIGRGNSLLAPQALTSCRDLSGRVGAVLDPIVAIRHRVTLEPRATVTLDLVIGVAESRAASLELVEKYRDRRLADRVFDLAWTHNQVVLRQLNASETEAQLYGRLANSVIYSHAWLRADPAIISSNHRGQSGLWAHAISGDLPIVLLLINDLEQIELVRQLVKAHAYWRLKGLAVDLVIWNEDRNGYRQLLQEHIIDLIAWSVEAQMLDHPGGIFVRQTDQLPNEDRILIQSVARVILNANQGTLAEQINRRHVPTVRVPRLQTSPYPSLQKIRVGQLTAPSLILANGLGGFSRDGREYIIAPAAGQTTPAPWVNVLANAQFGTVISESGQAYTWSENAHEFRLTPWHNDPISDPSGEALYLRDEDSGHFWSPTPLPRAGSGAYISRHGFGYSVFEHDEDGIHSELTVFVALDAAVKCSILKIHNSSKQERHLSATGYVEWVLGDLRPKSTPYIITEYIPGSSALLARNPYSPEFAERIAFFAVSDNNLTVTSDRREFIGRNGTLQNPLAMQRAYLSGTAGAALDPCAALQVPFTLASGQTREIVFSLGVGSNPADAQALIRRFRGVAATRQALAAVHAYWTHTLSAVQIETPDPSINVLANGWLLYQTLACRFWGRSGYYQSGGAYGFRDQLQDAMALVHSKPQMVRAHLLLCAQHQFIEGDVQHWWHPPTNRGVRTHCSDDYLWLPLVTCRYLTTTGDLSVLDEQATFLSGRAVNADEDSYYDLPMQSHETASLYQHCVQAILHGLRFGEHGLPLMGSGDWNDGMNLVGMGGKGESVWLGFFLCEVLTQFAAVAHARGDLPFAERCQSECYQLHQNLERHGWDGEWYRRAYFDDGIALGSASNPECQIDSIAQSWSVLSGVGSAERCQQAMQSLNTRLVRRDAALIQLLDPPFDTTTLDPGYIRGYLPGVRENGGQYTHAAIWAAMAFARLGDNTRAWELLTLINPINHGLSPASIATYKVEPYVVAADVYAVAPHTGRGGWTWYTGSAGWLYRLITESLLGLQREGDSLRFAPCLPDTWSGFKMDYRYGETLYHIQVSQHAATHEPSIMPSVTVDGVKQAEGVIVLVNDHLEHQVEVKISKPG